MIQHEIGQQMFQSFTILLEGLHRVTMFTSRGSLLMNPNSAEIAFRQIACLIVSQDRWYSRTNKNGSFNIFFKKNFMIPLRKIFQKSVN